MTRAEELLLFRAVSLAFGLVARGGIGLERAAEIAGERLQVDADLVQQLLERKTEECRLSREETAEEAQRKRAARAAASTRSTSGRETLSLRRTEEAE